jgi:DNA-binding PadR family transcriptional regulator
MRDTLPDPVKLLPLPAATFHILMAVSDEDRHGYAIIQDIAARTNGELKMSAGTLYRSIQRMLDQGLLIETDTRPAPDQDDERRRYYRISKYGIAVARAEMQRLSQLLKLAQRSRFAPGRA